MTNDRREELERIERELLAQDAQTPAQEDVGAEVEDILNDKMIRDILAEPAFEDMDEIKDPTEPLVYCNYSNDYGRDLEEFTDSGEVPAAAEKEDKLSIGLMFTASALCLGLVAVMIFWLVHYL